MGTPFGSSSLQRPDRPSLSSKSMTCRATVSERDRGWSSDQNLRNHQPKKPECWTELRKKCLSLVKKKKFYSSIDSGWCDEFTTPVSSAMKISASPRNTRDQIIPMLQLMFTFVISFQQQKQTWPNPTLFVGFWDLLEVLHIPQSSISTHDATCRALFEIFIPFHPVSSTQKAVRMIISGFFPLVFLWGINHVNHPQPLVESITPQWLLVLRCWSTTPLVTSGKLTILYITGLPDVSETRRMLGAWQKPKGMLVSLVQNGPKVTQKFRRFSTGFGHGPTSCARVHMVSRSHGKSWA